MAYVPLAEEVDDTHRVANEGVPQLVRDGYTSRLVEVEPVRIRVGVGGWARVRVRVKVRVGVGLGLGLG